MQQRPFTALVLAGGIGSRFRSATPKVVHSLLGRPIVAWPAAAATEAGAQRIVVVAAANTQQAIAAALPTATVVIQPEARGTGDAARIGLAEIADNELVLITVGDAPCFRPETFATLAAAAPANGLAVLTATLDDPSGYGRIVRNAEGHIVRIVEQRDADAATAAIHEVNTGIYAAPAAVLKHLSAQLGTDNAQGEYYLVDIVALAAASGLEVVGVALADPREMQGINDRAQWAAAAACLRDRLVAAWQAQGVAFVDPSSVWIEPTVTLAADVLIGADVELRGATRVDGPACIERGCVLHDTTVAAGAHLKPYCICDGAVIATDATVGPFAHLRPGSELGARSRVGNFVELKNTRLGEDSKANHLSYLGDAVIGNAVNVGAGTITCNYDGFTKHRTVIEDGVMIGSDTQLVAPVRVGRGAYVAAGTTVTKDVEPDALSTSRTPQKNIPGWAATKRARAAKAKAKE